VLQGANFIRAKEHEEDRDAVRQRLVNLDRLFRHVQFETQSWTRMGLGRQIGGDFLPEKTEYVDAILQHLCFDVGVKPLNVDPQGISAPRQ